MGTYSQTPIMKVIITNKNRNTFKVEVFSTAKIFKEGVIVTLQDWGLEFKAPTLDYHGKTHKFTQLVGRYRAVIVGDFKEGTFDLEREDLKLIAEYKI
jgi:hypothetical protein